MLKRQLTSHHIAEEDHSSVSPANARTSSSSKRRRSQRSCFKYLSVGAWNDLAAPSTIELYHAADLLGLPKVRTIPGETWSGSCSSRSPAAKCEPATTDNDMITISKHMSTSQISMNPEDAYDKDKYVVAAEPSNFEEPLKLRACSRAPTRQMLTWTELEHLMLRSEEAISFPSLAVVVTPEGSPKHQTWANSWSASICGDST